ISTVIAQQLQNLLPTILAQVGNQGSNLRNGRNQNCDVVNDNIQGDVRNAIENDDRRGCTYKELLACNLKEYDGGQVGGQGSEVNDGVNGVPDFSTIIAQQLQNLLPTIIAQVGDQGRGQGNCRNQNGNAVNDNIRGDVSRGCTYKEFLACNPNEYDGKGGAIVYTCWIEKMESVQDMSGCRDSQKVKAGHAAYTDRFHEFARLVPHLITLEKKMIERYGSIKKNPEKRGNGGEPM
nr:reverse transcriptase domain-containing protein [Tanacetum cinerariifolium]